MYVDDEDRKRLSTSIASSQGNALHTMTHECRKQVSTGIASLQQDNALQTTNYEGRESIPITILCGTPMQTIKSCRTSSQAPETQQIKSTKLLMLCKKPNADSLEATDLYCQCCRSHIWTRTNCQRALRSGSAGFAE